MAIVIFNPTEFKAQYPMFAGVDDAFLQGCFNQATLYVNNTECSRICDIDERKILLYLLTAHIAYLMGALNADGSVNPVGRASSATEGSVSVSFDYGPVTNREAWYVQTPWGAAAWAAMAKYRSFNYRWRATQWR